MSRSEVSNVGNSVYKKCASISVSNSITSIEIIKKRYLIYKGSYMI